MYITKVKVMNYQSHEVTEVDLTKGINVFVGTSNSGKSSFLRALRWNLTNQPSGDEFIKVGSREATVTVTWSDGHAVERKRNKGGSKNTYTLYKDGEVVEEYTGFGTTVPPKILEITGINPELKFNFANQLEAPFLLSDTPKVRAETVGNLEELGKIDLELTNVNDDISTMKRDQKKEAAELAELEREKNDLMTSIRVDRSRVETLKALQEAIIEKNKLLKEMEKLKPRFFELRSELDHIQAQLDSSNRILGAWDESLPEQVEKVTRVMQIASRLVEIRNEAALIKVIGDQQIEQLSEMTDIVTELSGSCQRLMQLNGQIERIRDDKETLRNSYSPIVAGLQFADIDQEVERFTALFRHQKRLMDIKDEQVSTDKSIQQFNEQIDSLLEEFVDALKDSEMCPTCFQDTTEVNKTMVEEAI